VSEDGIGNVGWDRGVVFISSLSCARPGYVWRQSSGGDTVFYNVPLRVVRN